MTHWCVWRDAYIRWATYPNILPEETHCNTLQHTATHCNAHCNAHCNTLQRYISQYPTWGNTLQHTATHYNALQHNTTQYNTVHAPISYQRHVIGLTPSSATSLDRTLAVSFFLHALTYVCTRACARTCSLSFSLSLLPPPPPLFLSLSVFLSHHIGCFSLII